MFRQSSPIYSEKRSNDSRKDDKL